MMKIEMLSRWGMLAFLGVALVAGLASLEQSQAFAVVPPGPECGPTYLWICVVPGCPTCPDVLFEGTICEKVQYERQTGRVCSHYPG